MTATSIFIHPADLRIPARIDFESFRAWTRSDEFPEEGRIDFLSGEVDIDMSPEEISSHGTPEVEIASRLQRIIVDRDPPGVVLCDRSRIVVPGVELSAEPDVVALLPETLASGRLRMVPKAKGERGRFVEIEGAPDLVVECVSDSSVAKDTKRLLDLYRRAGVREYWVVDARGATPPSLVVRALAAGEYEAQAADADGLTRSPLLGMSFQLQRREAPGGLSVYRLVERTAG